MSPEISPTPAPKLSVAMIVRDEAARIRTALASVRPIADDLVVVDTGSQDDTPALAAAAGARVLTAAWTDDFAAARNVSLEAARGEWILVLDADEALDAGSVDALRDLVAQTPGQPTAVEVIIRNWTSGDSGAGFDHRAVRLFSNHPSLRYQGRLHARLTHQEQGDAGVHWQLAPGIRIDHWGYGDEARRAMDKSARSQRLLSQLVADDPQDPSSQHHLGLWHWSEQRPAEALAAFEQALHLSAERPLSPRLLARTHLLRVACQVKLDAPALAIEIARQAEPFCQEEPDFWFNLGLAHQALSGHAAALQAFQRCLALKDAWPDMAEHGTRGWKTLLAMATSLDATDDRQGAMQARWQSLRDFPAQPALHGRLWAQACLDDAADDRAEAFRIWQNLTAAQQVAVATVCIETLEAMNAWPLAERVARDFVLTLPADHCRDIVQRLVGTLRHRNADVGELTALFGATLLQAGETVRAEALLQAASAYGNPGPDVWNNLGVIALQRAAVPEATALFLKAIAGDPTHFSANLNLVRTAWWAKDTVQATERLETAVNTLEGLLASPPGRKLEAAVRDLEALLNYFHHWDMQRQRDRQPAATPGTDAFLHTLYRTRQQVLMRLNALPKRH